MVFQALSQWIVQQWYRSSLSAITILLLPFSFLFRGIVAIRRFLYRHQIKKTFHFSVPVIIVGNITLGGTGKTPFVIWLANRLQKEGYRVGVVSRGVGGKKQKLPCWVQSNSDPTDVGDEALLLAHHLPCPLVISRDRVAAVDMLLKKSNCNVIISDDGLQHYRLGRDMEIVLIDGVRTLGNNQLLPAGPLREAATRVKQADCIIMHGGEHSTMQLQGIELVGLQDAKKTMLLETYRGKTVHAIAGIGHPERFFESLRNQGLNVIPHVFPDHYQYQSSDIHFDDAFPVIMTEKDAVKCKPFANEMHWYLPVTAEIETSTADKIIAIIKTYNEKYIKQEKV